MTKRIQRRRVRGWRLPAGAVCVTRPSVFGNPFRVGSRNPWDPDQMTAERAVYLYRVWLTGDNHLLRDYVPLAGLRARVLARLPELVGKDLACFCREDAEHCHASVLLELARELRRERLTRDDALRLGA